jgi:hypothetical protein
MFVSFGPLPISETRVARLHPLRPAMAISAAIIGRLRLCMNAVFIVLLPYWAMTGSARLNT